MRRRSPEARSGRPYRGALGRLAAWLVVGLGVAHGYALAGEAAVSDPAKPRIYMLLYRGITDAERGFMSYFSERGIEAEFIIRDSAEDLGRLGDHIAELRELRSDLAYTFGTTVTAAVPGLDQRSAKGGIDDIPVVFTIVADPVGAGLANSLSTPGGNATGVSHLVPLENQLAALRSVVPLQRLGVVYNPLEKNALLAVEQLQAVAVQEHFELLRAPVTLDADGKPNAAALPSLVDTLAGAGIDAIYLPSDSFIISQAATVVERAHSAGMPTFSATEAPVREHGALMGLVSRYFNVGQFAACKAEEILFKGRNPGSIPIERLNRFSLVINMKAARQLKLYPPVSVFRFAEVVR